jgi:hypothetical protein
MGEYKAPKRPFRAGRDAKSSLFLGKYRLAAAGTRHMRPAI